MGGNACGSRTFPRWRHLVREMAPNVAGTKSRQRDNYETRSSYTSYRLGVRLSPASRVRRAVANQTLQQRPRCTDYSCTSCPALPGSGQSVQVKFGISVSGVPSPMVISRRDVSSIARQSLSTLVTVPLSVTKTSTGRPSMPATLVVVRVGPRYRTRRPASGFARNPSARATGRASSRVDAVVAPRISRCADQVRKRQVIAVEDDGDVGVRVVVNRGRALDVIYRPIPARQSRCCHSPSTVRRRAISPVTSVTVDDSGGAEDAGGGGGGGAGTGAGGLPPPVRHFPRHLHHRMPSGRTLTTATNHAEFRRFRVLAHCSSCL